MARHVHEQFLEKGGIPSREPWEKLQERAQLYRWGAEGVAVGKYHYWKSQQSRPAKSVRVCLNGGRSQLGRARKRTWGKDQHYHTGVSGHPDRILTVSLQDVDTSREQDVLKIYNTMYLFQLDCQPYQVPISQEFHGGSVAKTLLPAPNAGGPMFQKLRSTCYT